MAGEFNYLDAWRQSQRAEGVAAGQPSALPTIQELPYGSASPNGECGHFRSEPLTRRGDQELEPGGGTNSWILWDGAKFSVVH